MESSPCPRRLLLASVTTGSLLHWLPVWLPRRIAQDHNVPLTWRAWQDSNPRPAA
jgi:hypothetical protein